MALAEKPHAVCVPFPHQSHIKAMMNLAKLLHHKGFFITFVNTEFNHRRLLKAKGSSFLTLLPDFRFETIPDGLPPSDSDSTQKTSLLCESIPLNFMAPFVHLLARLNQTAALPVSCILADFLMPFSIAAGAELGIPVVSFFTVAACTVMGVYKSRYLLESNLVPFKDMSYFTDSYLENTCIEWINGKSIRLKDLPSYIRTSDPNDILFHFHMESAEMACKASAVIIHTFDALEQEALKALSLYCPVVYAIGPHQLLLNQIPKENPINLIECNMWKEEAECLEWLKSKESNSVLYVNFGSVVVLTPQQLIEFCWGIANSKHPFLWVVRPDLISGGSSILPPEFLEETEDRGKIAGWCPQEKVLNHPSTGGFLTHCGWNSTIESLSAAVPMICWPVVADQQMNCRYTCSDWEIGVEIANEVNRNEVERLVRELMEGEKGRKMRNRAREWKKVAEDAGSHSGSSSFNLNQLVKTLTSKQ